MGLGKGKGRVLPAGRENPDGKSSVVGGREEGRKASGLAENPRGDCQGVGERFELPRGIDTLVVEELPWRDKTSGVTPEGDRVPGADRWGRGGDGNPPTT